MTELQKQAILATKVVLKKIRAAKGRLQGNFYWAGSSSCDSIGLVVTLSSKDADGDKALRHGKPLRGEIRGGKFARGLVKMNSGKLVFELYGGSANKTLIQKSFKTNLNKIDGLSYIIQAIVVHPDVDSEKAIQTTIAKAEKVESAKLTISDILDIKAQHELVDLNGTLMQAFLSHDDIQDELDAAISGCLEEIKSLQAAGDDDEVKAVRTALAEMLWSGDDPFPGVGDQMSAEDQELFSSALQEANHLLMQHMAQSAKRIEEIYDFTVTAEEQALTEQSGKLLQELVPLREAYESYVEQLQENQPK